MASLSLGDDRFPILSCLTFARAAERFGACRKAARRWTGFARCCRFVSGACSARVFVALGVACGTDTTDVGDQLDARVFLSQSVEGHALVPGTRIRLTFRGGRVGAQLGCNSMSVGFDVVDDRLRLASGGLSTTEIGYEPALRAQDEWMAEFLGSGPKVALDRSRLTLSSATAVLGFLDRRIVGSGNWRSHAGVPRRRNAAGDLRWMHRSVGRLRVRTRSLSLLVRRAARSTATLQRAGRPPPA